MLVRWPCSGSQLYLLNDRAVTASVAERAEAAGAGALVVTVDSPWLARRNRGADHPDRRAGRRDGPLRPP
jgi:isopentenyl diphosphate isomerase/L-lactate dehydrogenase-like FMN-dependent dehydrogenase